MFYMPPDKSAYWKLFFRISQQKTCCGTQKKGLNATVLLSTKKHMFKLKGKEINAILGAQTILIWNYESFNPIFNIQEES